MSDSKADEIPSNGTICTTRDVEVEAEAGGASGGEALFESLEVEAEASKIRLRLRKVFEKFIF